MRIKKIIFVIIYHIFIMVLVLLFMFKYAEEIIHLKSNIYFHLQTSQADSNIDFTDYPLFEPSGDLWFQNTRLVCHAGGGIDGLDYTNSKEAIENTLSNGNRYIEIDFAYTSDKELVCMHYWDEQWSGSTIPTLQEFLTGRIFGKYTPMTASDLVQYMNDYPDLYIIIDTKESDYVQVIQNLVELSSYNTDITDRFIIQLYSEGKKDEIKSFYPFADSNFLFTAYNFGANRPNKILDICYKENIFIVTVPYRAWDQETLDLYNSKNIVIFEHSINRPDLAHEELQKGVYGIYTDFLSSEDLEL